MSGLRLAGVPVRPQHQPYGVPPTTLGGDAAAFRSPATPATPATTEATSGRPATPASSPLSAPCQRQRKTLVAADQEALGPTGRVVGIDAEFACPFQQGGQHGPGFDAGQCGSGA